MRVGTLLLGGAILVLAGCDSFPRGAALQSEILAAATSSADQSGTPVSAEFAVVPVTRETVDRLAEWPAVGQSGLPWIERVDQPNNRIIAPGDLLTVTIWNAEENSLLTMPGQRFVTLPPVQVGAGGDVFLPYIGQLTVSGIAPDTARERIEDEYLAIVPSAQIQLSMDEGRQNTVSLVGGVAEAGVFPLADQDVTVLELLAMGGGIVPGLVNPQIRLQRGDTLYGTSVNRLMENPDLNTTLRGGDRVYIEEEERYFLSLGAAGSETQQFFPQDRITALDALALVGGVAEERADTQGILVLRRYPEQAVRHDATGPDHVRTVFIIDLTSADGLFSAGQFRIMPGDLVYVTESPLIGARMVMGLIGTVFGLANQI